MPIDTGTYSPEDFEQMKRIERALVQATVPFRENTNPMLTAMALTRMARTVLRLCNKNDQQQLLPVLIAFLQGRIAPPKSEGSPIWMPGDDGRVM